MVNSMMQFLLSIIIFDRQEVFFFLQTENK